VSHSNDEDSEVDQGSMQYLKGL